MDWLGLGEKIKMEDIGLSEEEIEKIKMISPCMQTLYSIQTLFCKMLRHIHRDFSRTTAVYLVCN